MFQHYAEDDSVSISDDGSSSSHGDVGVGPGANYAPVKDAKATIFVKAKVVPKVDKVDMSEPKTDNPFGVDEHGDEFKTPEPVLKEERADMNELQMRKHYGVGMSLMMKMGFKVGSGLGKHEDGIKNPVQAKVRKGKEGLTEQEEEKKTVDIDIDEIDKDNHSGLGMDDYDPSKYDHLPNEGWVRGRRTKRVVYKSRENFMDGMKQILARDDLGGKAMKIIDMSGIGGPREVDTQTLGKGVIEEVDASLKLGGGHGQLLYYVESALQGLEVFIQSYHRSGNDEQRKKLSLHNEKLRIQEKLDAIENRGSSSHRISQDVHRIIRKHCDILGDMQIPHDEDGMAKVEEHEPKPDIPSLKIEKLLIEVRLLAEDYGTSLLSYEPQVLFANLLCRVIACLKTDDFASDDVRKAILEWRVILDDDKWDYIVKEAIIPKLITLVEKVEIISNSDFEAIVTLSKWSPNPLDDRHITGILTKGLFPRWLTCLERWLITNPPKTEILNWYTSWRKFLPKAIEETTEGRHQLAKGLGAIRRRHEPVI